MESGSNTCFYDRPIGKNRFLGALLLLTVISAVIYYFDKNIAYLVISMIFGLQFLFSVSLIFTRERYCKFTAEYIEFRDNFFKPVKKINPSYLLNILISDGAIIFNRVNGSEDKLDFPSKYSGFFNKRIGTFAKNYNLEQLKKIYLKDKNVKISELMQNTFPLIMIIIISVLQKKKSLTDISLWFMLFFILVGFASFYIRKNFRNFLFIGDSTLTIKNSLFKAEQKIPVENIKRIDKQKQKFYVTSYTNQKYTISPSKENIQNVKEPLLKLIKDRGIHSNFSKESSPIKKTSSDKEELSLPTVK